VSGKRYVNENKILPSIPLRLFVDADTCYKEYENNLNVTIIGATDKRRRQYEEVIETFVDLFKTKNPPKIHLILLGNSNNLYGKSIITKLKEISHQNFSLKTYTAQVSETEFINQIKHTHLVISPITNTATTDIFKEIYGKTKTTGSILDFLKFGKVTLVPKHYSVSAELTDYIINYDNKNQLSEIILDLLNEKKLNTLNKRSMEYVMKNYSQQAVLKDTVDIFKSIASL
jgi:GTPase SAR1 family protein